MIFYEKKDRARTYLIVDSDDDHDTIVAYISLAITHIKVCEDTPLSKTIRKRMDLHNNMTNAYLIGQLAWLISHKASSDALFFATGNQYGYMSGNSVRRLKTKVEEQIGEKFELRDCRRAFDQFYLYKGLSISKVSVFMGHDTTKTTEEYYCRNSEREAIKEASSLW